MRRDRQPVGRDTSAEPLFETCDIQGDILVGLVKKAQKFVFFTIEDEADFRRFLATLEITTMQDCLDQRAAVAEKRAAGVVELQPTPGLNIAFTHAGLAELGGAELGLAQFANGMAASQATLADPDPENWKILRPSQNPPVHGVFLVTGATAAEVDDTILLRLATEADNGWAQVRIAEGAVRPEPFVGREHFGYADGVSQPAVRGRIGPDQPLDPTTGSDQNQAEPGRDLLWPGEFVFGYSGQHPDVDDMAEEGPPPEPDTPFTRNGAFLVFRRLAQKVPEFDLAVKKAAAEKGLPADLLGAQMVGRWKSGAPLINAPHADNADVAAGTVGALDFEFDGDRSGLLCPWAAHIRKVYARDDVPGNIGPTHDDVEAEEAKTQRHRMIRRGIAFGPELTPEEALNGTTTQERGLLFACYVTDIARQFEVLQEDRVNNQNFVQPDAGVDAIIGQSADADALPFTAGMPFSEGKKAELQFPRFVHMDGGEYFFAPSLTTIRGLAKK